MCLGHPEGTLEEDIRVQQCCPGSWGRCVNRKCAPRHAAGTIPEAASVVEAPISQVPLHKVNMFATDPTDAADGAACSSQSLQGRVGSC